MAARPCCRRRIGCQPAASYFKPGGIPLRDLSVQTLYLDELEAIRLADLEGLYHEQGAERMGVSRATFGRILEGARRKIATVLVQGQALRIEGEKEGVEGESPRLMETEAPATGADKTETVRTPEVTSVGETARGRCGCGRRKRGVHLKQEGFPDSVRQEGTEISGSLREPLAQDATDSQHHTEEVSS